MHDEHVYILFKSTFVYTVRMAPEQFYNSTHRCAGTAIIDTLYPLSDWRVSFFLSFFLLSFFLSFFFFF